MLENEERAPREARVEHALTRYLQGQRITTIAEDLAVSASTVRRWVGEALAAMADETRAERVALLTRSIESQRAVASAAWEAYERERALDEALLRGDLDRVRRRALRGGRPHQTPSSGEDDCPPVAEEEYERPKRSTQGPRYLALALAAQRDVARLQGLYSRLEVSQSKSSITIIKRAAGPENVPPAPPDTEAPK